MWGALVATSGTEVAVLMETPIDDIRKVAADIVAEAILAFREGRIKVMPGGGGRYGTILLPGEVVAAQVPEKAGQKSLFDFGG